jgi:lipid-binding SYLF domain-containing protein
MAGCALPAARAGADEDRTVVSAAAVLHEVMSIPLRQIPQAMLADAQGVAIIPHVIKLGFVVGGQYGRGVVLLRQPDGTWGPPRFVTLAGGSVGWQVGAQATDFVLVFKTAKSLDGLRRGKFTIGADAAAAAGPVGRRMEAATDVQLKAEIYSYSRSRGLFAGVSLEGSVLELDPHAHAAYYGSPPAQPPARLPASAFRLMDLVTRLTGAPALPVAVEAPPPVPVVAAPPPPADLLRQELADASLRLSALLDEDWKRFLALPAEVCQGRGHPPAGALHGALRQFDAVARDGRYRELTQRPEFQATYDLLQKYHRSLTPAGPVRLVLPPPPSQPAPVPGPR